MEKRIIGRGLLAGALAGVFAFVFAKIFLEPIVGRAIDFEDGSSETHEAMQHGGHAHEHGIELFTRGVQSNIGMGFGVLAFSVAMGALFAVVYCVAYGRFGGNAGHVSARSLSVLVAGGMLIALWVVPALKYPPNPPATSLEETIQQRALLYLLMVVLSATLMVAAVYLGRRLSSRLGAWNATLTAGGAYLVAVLIVMVALPTINETPGPMRDDAGDIVFPGFPAVDLYEFRLYATLTQLIIWVTIGLAFGAMAARLLDARQRESVTA